MKGKLFSYYVITSAEKDLIDTLIGNAKMEKVLDIVRVSLEANQTAKYKGFLQAMEESEDTLLKDKAKELGKWIDKCAYIIQSLLHVYVGTCLKYTLMK